MIGLIGGMGSGKSRVAAEFARHGGKVIAADQLGHDALRQPDIRERVVRHFGREVLNEQGEIDRKKLGPLVFADPAQRKALEALVFPYIGRRIEEEIAAARKEPEVAWVILDAAIMLEAGWAGACDRLIYVHAPRDVRLRRLAEQRGWNTKEVEVRENAQWPLTEKSNRADAVVDNSGSPEQTARQVEALLRGWGLFDTTDGVC